MITLALRRSYAVLNALLVISLGGCGWFSSSETESDPSIEISISADNLSPRLIEQQIAIPIESELRHIQSIERVNIHIVDGFVCFQIAIDSAQNPESAHTDVTSAVARLAPTFPDAASQPTIKMVSGEISDSLCPPGI